MMANNFNKGLHRHLYSHLYKGRYTARPSRLFKGQGKSQYKGQCRAECEGQVQPLLLLKLFVAGILLLWLLHSLWQLTQMVTRTTEAPSASTIDTSTSIEQSESRASVDISILKAIPLFGEVIAEDEIVEAEPEPEPEEEPVVETKLNLVLKGLFASEDDSLGQAIIANGRNDQLYQVDDEINGLSNVTLTAVYSDRVKLNNRGSAEVLYLYPEGERLSSAPTSRVVDNTSASNVNNIPGVEERNPELLSTDFKNIEQPGSTKKLNQILRVVRERDKSTGEMLGFRVLPGRDRRGFELSGLQANDIITRIDGDSLTDLRTAMAIYRDKRDASQVSLTVNRGGSEMSLDLDLGQLEP